MVLDIPRRLVLDPASNVTRKVNRAFHSLISIRVNSAVRLDEKCVDDESGNHHQATDHQDGEMPAAGNKQGVGIRRSKCCFVTVLIASAAVLFSVVLLAVTLAMTVPGLIDVSGETREKLV
jgi:hypothetical protein